MTTNTSNKRHKLPTTRIGKAAVGRTLLIFMEKLIMSNLTAASMRTTMQAVFIYLQTPDILIDSALDTDIFTPIKNEIDLSFERSQKARQRAALRKAAREAATLSTPQTTAVSGSEQTQCINDECGPETILAKTSGEETVAPPAKKRHPVRDTDEPSFTYNPPQTKPPKAYVINEEDEVEPYDPYGVRRAVEMQRVPRLLYPNYLPNGRGW